MQFPCKTAHTHGRKLFCSTASVLGLNSKKKISLINRGKCNIFVVNATQWRISYGLRVGKHAGTRAEGAPSGCPFTLVFQLRLPFHKGVPSQHFFFIVWLQNSHNDAFRSLMKSELFGYPYNQGRGGGNELHICKINGDVPPK